MGSKTSMKLAFKKGYKLHRHLAVKTVQIL